MSSSSLILPLALSLYEEALALARHARDRMAAAPHGPAPAGELPAGNIAAMPAVAELVHLIADIAGLVARFGRDASAPGERNVVTAAASRLGSPPPELLPSAISRLRHRYEWLLQSIEDGSGLPLKNAAPASSDGIARGIPVAKRMRALVIEDDALYRLLVSQVLREKGWSVDEAWDGQVGWQLFKISEYDLVVTDIVMPYQEGLETIRLMRGSRARVGIVAISGGGELNVDYLGMARLLGADRCLAKPFQPAELLASVASLNEVGA